MPPVISGWRTNAGDTSGLRLELGHALDERRIRQHGVAGAQRKRGQQWERPVRDLVTEPPASMLVSRPVIVVGERAVERLQVARVAVLKAVVELGVHGMAFEEHPDAEVVLTQTIELCVMGVQQRAPFRRYASRDLIRDRDHVLERVQRLSASRLAHGIERQVVKPPNPVLEEAHEQDLQVVRRLVGDRSHDLALVVVRRAVTPDSLEAPDVLIDEDDAAQPVKAPENPGRKPERPQHLLPRNLVERGDILRHFRPSRWRRRSPPRSPDRPGPQDRGRCVTAATHAAWLP